MPKKNYDYGSSVISTDLKYEFKDNQLKNKKIEGRFFLELKVYCGAKKMFETSKDYSNITINTAIKNLFQTKVEQKTTFHKGYNYYATFKVYELKPVRRPKYKKTDTYINTERRKYLLQERINIYF
ncbi:MAG: hypothetical protein NC310_08015 [Roseburia sp.]|nr:hypothetical protein [Roseburia sp.]